MPIRKKSSRVPPMQMAKEYLQAYPSATNQQVVEALNISVRTVTNARAALIQMGLLPRSYFDRKNMTGPVVASPTQASPENPLTPEGIAELGAALGTIQTTPDSPGLTLAEMRERLSAVARRAAFEGAGSLEIAAIQAIAKLDAASGERDKLGPGVPLTRADKVSRLGILMKVCGLSIVNEAMSRIFNIGTYAQIPIPANRTPEEIALAEELLDIIVTTNPNERADDGQPTQENQAQPAEAGTQGDGSGISERPDEVRAGALREEPGEVAGSSNG